MDINYPKAGVVDVHHDFPILHMGSSGYSGHIDLLRRSMDLGTYC